MYSSACHWWVFISVVIYDSLLQIRLDGKFFCLKSIPQIPSHFDHKLLTGMVTLFWSQTFQNTEEETKL